MGSTSPYTEATITNIKYEKNETFFPNAKSPYGSPDGGCAEPVGPGRRMENAESTADDAVGQRREPRERAG